MQEREYHEIVDDLFMELEDTLDELDHDLDVNASGGLLEVSFPNGSTVVLSRQPANQEIWVAAKSGGFHLAMVEDEWRCGTTDESLAVLLNRVFSEQLGVSVSVFG